MPVRVTQTMLNNNMMRNLSNSLGNMDKLQAQLSSGKKITRPSDDPVIATRGMYYRSSLIENEQYQRNVSEALSWMDVADNALNETGNILKRAQELVIQSGNGTLNSASLQAIGKEIAQLKEQIGNIANHTVGGRYIFAGTDTNNAPYDPAKDNGNGQKGDFVNTNTSDIQVEVNKQIFLPINVNGQQVFNFPDNANNIFKVLDSIINDLENGNSATAHLDKLNQQMDNVLAVRATLGARINRIELIEERLSSEEVNINKLMSVNEDADIAKVITDLKTQENVHRAALGAGARIIQPTLVDFLR